MKAKEFYELNKGKYFMYGNQKVRVVGFGPSHVIVSTKKRGIEFSTIDDIDRSLLHDGEKGLYAFISSLWPMVEEGDPVMTKWNSAAFWKLESYTKDNKSDFIVPVFDFDFSDFDSNKSKSIV